MYGDIKSRMDRSVVKSHFFENPNRMREYDNTKTVSEENTDLKGSKTANPAHPKPARFKASWMAQQLLPRRDVTMGSKTCLNRILSLCEYFF
jgi:hypothetical protein